MVMVSHAAYPQVTKTTTPASISRIWITDILRKRIGYRNLIVSDDLEMGGVLSAAPVEEAATEFVRAGGDLCLVCHREDYVTQAHEALIKAAERDRKFASRSAESIKRVLAFKKKWAKTMRASKMPAPAIVEKLTRRLWEFSEKSPVRRTGPRREHAATRMRKKAMVVAGVMSGTSADGINVALVRIQGSSKSRATLTAGSGRGRAHPADAITLIGQAEYSYSPKVRNAVLSAMNASRASVADLSRLNALLGELYADAVLETQRKFRTEVDLVGCHGQTLYHQGDKRLFLGRKVSTTWQTGEGAIIAARVGVPVVSDFRPADMAAGGKGAPLVPYLDYLWFRDAQMGRIVQNIGGIANLTAIPPRARPERLLAFDTGPGNMVIDAVTRKLFGRQFDPDGKIASTGAVLDAVVDTVMKRQFFRSKPPKTAGREEFGREFVQEFLRLCGRARKQDVVATATALTARSIAQADWQIRNPYR